MTGTTHRRTSEPADRPTDPARAPRMADVARLAGVSPQTVSRVINGHPNVSAEVRERVQQAVVALRYRRNPAARSLATRRTMSLGVVTYGLAQHGPSVALTGIADAARQAGYTTNLVGLVELDRAALRRALGHLMDDYVDGIVLLAPVDDAVHAVAGLHTEVPLVIFEPGAPPRPAGFAAHEVLGARLATQHLLDIGHETVLHLSGPAGWLATTARIRGWREALSDAGRHAPAPVATSWTAASGFEAVDRVIASGSTAVFAANDQTALGLIRGLTEHGVRVPEDVSVVGFDDFPESEYFSPPLTTVRVDFAALGRLAVRKLLALIEGEEVSGPLTPPTLVVRASTGTPPATSSTPPIPTTPKENP
ncbi:LacI family DNA-binding transcriptional regulator [Salana multivorans]|uniref:LacI family DNA-binding transcriptional regulator n=1 Tax=Salana multivorans TaxID=120377 RepID=UPI000AFA3CDE|nr:LacI family DNA-binding transcriptional regulator [Salana multivorans]